MQRKIGDYRVIDKNREDSPGSWMWLNQSDVDTWMAAISFYPAEKFGVFDNRYFVVYQRPYGNSILLKKQEKQTWTNRPGAAIRER